jgi:hypothetical protein
LCFEDLKLDLDMAKRKKEKSILAKLTVFSLGIGLIVLTGFLILSCISYNATDSGYNVANSQKISNWFGFYGSTSSAWVLGWFGLSLPVFLIAPLIWGYEIVRYKTFMHTYGRMIAFILGVLFFATFINLCFGEVNGFKTGGALGVFFSRRFLSLVNRIYPFAYNKELLAFVLFIVIISCFCCSNCVGTIVGNVIKAFKIANNEFC